LRMRLLPYLYSAFAQYQADGTPPFRAMVLEEGTGAESGGGSAGRLDSTANPYALGQAGSASDQYLIGPCLLVAPLFEGQTERRVLLPPGRWFDFHSSRAVGTGPGEISVAADLATIPILVRDGGIVPLMPPLLQAPAPGQRVDLEVRHYGDAPGRFELYDDDGLTLACERGECCRILLQVQPDLQGRLAGSVSLPEGQRPFTYGDLSWRFMTVSAGLGSR
jgi:alpha-glucosidase (family GH31 glycosyl hydrolase)